ncbi:MAG: hypothetical protein A2289_23295 [Deltaproteobacteria bacterium RIFOXYA12_FULL_58_15]|nr:MAG: hypothetical protein A2289_23295 [Deltaproteobacteria bacterium RIFOXYA12_FULL_58_15]
MDKNTVAKHRTAVKDADMMMQSKTVFLAIGALGVLVPQTGLAVDGVSVTAHWEGYNDWTIGAYGTIWRHDLVDSEVVARRRLNAGPGRMAVLSHDGSRVAFLKRGTGKITVMSIGGADAREVATAHEEATLDWPDLDTVYFNFGSWDSTGSSLLRRVNVDTGDVEQVIDWSSRIWRFGIANDEIRAVARSTSGTTDGRIVTYELPGDGNFNPDNATDEPSCGEAIDPTGEFFLDGMHAHEGYDIRRWDTLEIVQSFLHTDAVSWGGPDSGPHHNRNGWSTNSQDWICGHIGWDISAYVDEPTGANQVLYGWKPEMQQRIVVTPNRRGIWEIDDPHFETHIFDSAGDFWVGTPPVPASLGLRAYWLFDAADLSADASGAHTLMNQGVIAGNGRVHEAAEFVAAEQDELRIVDAQLADGTPWKLANGRTEMTIAGWFKKTRVGAREYLLQKGSFVRDDHSFGVVVAPGAGDDDLCVELARYPHGATVDSARATHYCWEDQVAADTWYFFAVSLDVQRTLRIRIWDGTASTWLAPEQSFTLVEPPIFTDGDLVIGCGDWEGVSRCIDGALDDLRVFDYALSTADLDGLIAPTGCTEQGAMCCAAGNICDDLVGGSGCASGEACCGSAGACTVPACGDGLCSPAENCEADGCCAGHLLEDGISLCCGGTFVVGNCCDLEQCPDGEACLDNRCVAPILSPRAHWAMEAGALTVDSVGSNTLTLTDVGEQAGRRGGGAGFSAGTLSIADADLDPGMPLKSDGGAAELTVLGWLNRGRTGVFEYVLQKGDGVSNKLSLGLYFYDDDNLLCVEIGLPPGRESDDFCGGAALQSFRWYFFAATLAADGAASLRVWDDVAGQWLAEGLGQISGGVNIEDGQLRIGNGAWDSEQPFKGVLDEIRIYDYAMSADQVDRVRRRDLAGDNNPPAVDAGADMDGVSGSTVLGTDASASDPNDDLLVLTWSLVDGPGDALIASPHDLTTMVTFDLPGDYTFALVADDGELRSVDEVMVSVVPPPSIALVSPVGGEVWYVGSVQPIEWSAVDIDDVAILYSTDKGASWETVVGSVDASSPSWQSYPWTIPDTVSNECLVRLEGYFDRNNAVMSPAVFAIRPRPAAAPPSKIEDGCNCHSSGTSAPWVAALGLMALLRRRNRAKH